MRWDEASRTLTIGRREGSFPGMPADRAFEVVFVSRNRPAGFGARPDQTVRYRGDAVTVRMK